jgi:hypothetical protein
VRYGILAMVFARGPRDRAQFCVLAALAYQADDDDKPDPGVCWPKHRWLARHARMTIRSVSAALTRLEAGGWLTVERAAVKAGHSHRGPGAHNLYRLNVPRLRGTECMANSSMEAASTESSSMEAVACVKTTENGGKPPAKRGNRCGNAPEIASSMEIPSMERIAKPPDPLIGRPIKTGTHQEPKKPGRLRHPATAAGRKKPLSAPQTPHPGAAAGGDARP